MVYLPANPILSSEHLKTALTLLMTLSPFNRPRFNSIPANYHVRITAGGLALRHDFNDE